jgi:mannose-6-phosphate isomerase class I
MTRQSNYDKFPFIPVSSSDDCDAGWGSIAAKLAGRRVVCVECYPGAQSAQILRELADRMKPLAVFKAADAYKPPHAIRAMLAPRLGDDPVFGRMNRLVIEDWFDAAALRQMRGQIEAASARGSVLVVGTGAALLVERPDLLVFADMARWEIQLRFRRLEIGNLGCANREDGFAAKYKCGYFAEWRAADRLKKEVLPKADFLLDTNDSRSPKMISGDSVRGALAKTARSPFRVVPYFDPGPWGGHWMERVCNLPKDAPNHAWCFDCVPEENSLLLGFGEHRVEIPSIDLVFMHPRELLGEEIYERFGTEFPIRFDFLDTMGGGNLSLQVHPLIEYIRAEFGMEYTQDESYYLLDAEPGAQVYLGLKEGIDPAAMARNLRAAERGARDFPAEEYVNRWPAQRHDHFLIPAGTVHCSGRDCMVLEISATPYIFTFKLWDWGRMGLDGKPRPIHIEHGLNNIQWNRTTEWVRRNLVNQVTTLATGEGWREERTGLDEREFIETRRHWFTGAVTHDTQGGVNVLNLVQGEEAIVESPTGAFEPFIVHYVETFIVPAAAGKYTVRPHGAGAGTECATIKAFVRA